MKKLFFVAALLVAGVMSAMVSDQNPLFDAKKSMKPETFALEFGKFDLGAPLLKEEGVHCFERDENGGYKEVKCPEVIIVTDEQSQN
ncbi:hypothetical protein PG279_00065 [Riemerella anatipestifer]|nr:hypothetical protein [Riemerella anatipestifer]